MPDKRKHRGQHPSDAHLFSAEQLPRLRRAAADLSWLLSRGYSEKASIKLVGDRFRLKARQRMALARVTCSQQACELRLRKEVGAEQLFGSTLQIDAFNLLILVESALSGGLIFEAQDGCYRDIASIHGSYKRVSETRDAMLHCGEVLHSLQPERVYWLLDRPVSNSGRLKKMLEDIAVENNWKWVVELHYDPDSVLICADGIVVSSDRIVLNETTSWFNLARHLMDHRRPDIPVIRLFAKN